MTARALPSTVTIQAESSGGEGGTGTGFVFDTEGHIVTNNHVVADAVDGGKLTATFANGKKYDAEVVGNAQGYDVAVIKLKSAPSDLKPLTLGDSDKVAVGDSTIAIGAPSGSPTRSPPASSAPRTARSPPATAPAATPRT